MEPRFNGIYLAPGIYTLDEEKFKEYFVRNNYPRQILFDNLKRLMKDMESVNCRSFYIGGSFVSKISVPEDVDACWIVPINVTDEMLYANFPIALHPSDVKEKYGVHLLTVFPEEIAQNHLTYIDMYQINWDEEPVGIIKLEILQ